jgi:predicted ATPase
VPPAVRPGEWTDGSTRRHPAERVTGSVILTPDQRVRVFVSSTLEELGNERGAVRRGIESLHLAPVMFELGARPHPPRTLYRSYLEQSHVFVGVYWQRYGWVAPGMEISGLEDEYLLSGRRPKLIYVKRPAPERDGRLAELLDRIRSSDDVSYKAFSSADELERLVADDLALLLSEAFLVDVPTEQPGRPRLTLPGEATTFVGRVDEVDQLRSLVERDEVRLVTLTGPGGIGKTRLALRVASELAASFEEGAAFVDLAPLRDPALVPSAIAAAVGLRDLSPESMRDALKDDLAERSLLLVVDNVEHVLPAADLLQDILIAAPRVKILATSREALRVRAEHDFPVPALTSAESVRLFGERAAAASHGFQVDESSLETIAAICERLEHVPLAIELAAARARLLPPEALLERLDRRLDFLVGGARDLPERQRALRDTIQWSYDLLADDERRLFAGLAVFVGSFSLEAVYAVLGTESSRDVLDLLASLVDKSLLRTEATAGEPRFRMLGMIREFARDRLDESGEAEDVGDRHAAYYRDLCLVLGRAVRGPDQLRWLRRLRGGEGEGEGESGNVGAAMTWFLDHRRLDDFAEMAWSLWVPTWISGRLEEGQRLTHAALAADGDISARSRGRLLLVAGMFDMWKGEHRDAIPDLEEALAIGRADGDDEIVAYATIARSMAVGPLEGEARAEELAEQGLAASRRLRDRWGEAAALNALGWLYVAQEQFDDTGPVLEESLATAQDVADEQFIAMAEVNLAEYLLHHGDASAAASRLRSSVEHHHSVRSMYSVAYLLEAAARLALHRGDPTTGAVLIGAAASLRRTTGVSIWGRQLERRERLIDQLRTALGPRAFDDAAGTGTTLRYADALDVAASVS